MVRCYFKVQGVPHASILVPVLFILYINYFHGYIRTNRVSMYADDTTLTNCSPTIYELKQKTQRTLEGASEWLAANNLALNTGKNITCNTLCLKEIVIDCFCDSQNPSHCWRKSCFTYIVRQLSFGSHVWHPFYIYK